LIVHYGDKDNPVEVQFTVSPWSGNSVLNERKKIAHGTIRFNKPTQYGIGVFIDDYFGNINIYNKYGVRVGEVNSAEGFNYDSCKIDVYLDSTGQVIKVIETESSIPFLCF
jgi:hypothetical protein